MGSSRNSASRIILLILGVGNLLGALVSFFYFRFVDSTAAELPDVGILEIAYSIVAFGLLVFIGYRVGRRWADPLISWRGPEGLPDATIAMTRRRAPALCPMRWPASRSWAGCWPACSGASSGRSSPAPWRRTASSARSSATR